MSDDEDIRRTDGPPTPDPALRRLDFVVGSWRIEGETVPEFGGPQLRSMSTATFEWQDGGFFLESGPARFTLVENPDGTVTNDWELRDDNGDWRPWRHTTMTRIA